MSVNLSYQSVLVLLEGNIQSFYHEAKLVFGSRHKTLVSVNFVFPRCEAGEMNIISCVDLIIDLFHSRHFGMK